MVKSIELRYETDTRSLSHGKSYVSSDVCSIIIYVFFAVKDARFVSWYPYTQSQILQYVKYTNWLKIPRGIAKFHDK